jgi:predicted amidohydrolase
MKVAAVQHDIAFEDAPATCAALRPLLDQASAAGARLIVLTEMFATGYTMRPERFAEDEGGPVEQWLLEQAKARDAHLIGSVAQRGPDGRFRNNGLVASPDGRLERYAKIHPFTYSREHEHYAAGEKSLTVDLDGVRTSIFVCYDLRFADDFWPLAPDTDLYVVPANWPRERREHWRVLLRARAVENQAYVVGVNRVGSRGDLHYVGDSAVIDPLGRALVEASEAPAVLVAEIDPATVASVRRDLPFLPDRR